MNKLLVAVLVAFTSSFAVAGQVEATPRKQKGINEAVTIKSLGSSWGFVTESQGFYVGGKNVFNIIPVTREAAQVLQSLDKTVEYNCILENSTFVKDKGDGLAGGAYYVLDINCN